MQLLIGRGLFMVSGYVITVILARGLGPAAYGGVRVVIMSLLLWIEVVGDLGIQRATIKMIPEARGRHGGGPDCLGPPAAGIGRCCS